MIPKPSRTVIVAILLLVAVRIAIALVNDEVLTEIDSRWTHKVLVNDLKADEMRAAPPTIVLAGTSRSMYVGARAVARHAGLAPNEVLNLSMTGADFVNIEMVLRRNPLVTSNARVLMLDIMPMQLMRNHNYDEHGESFLRFASMDQRLRAKGLASKLIGIGNALMPVQSRTQDPYQWRLGIERLGMDPVERATYIKSIPLDRFEAWTQLVERVEEARMENLVVLECAQIFFPQPEVMPNHVDAFWRLFELTPDNCTIVAVWLPFREDVMEIVRETPEMTKSYDLFESFIRSVSHPRFKLRWFNAPEDLGLGTSDYSDDGVHFSPSGLKRLGELYAGFAREEMEAGDAVEGL